MTCGEVATAKRLGITLLVVVLDDRWLARSWSLVRRQFPLYGTEPGGITARPRRTIGVRRWANNSGALETR
jgi:hypothetical protein